MITSRARSPIWLRQRHLIWSRIDERFLGEQVVVVRVSRWTVAVAPKAFNDTPVCLSSSFSEARFEQSIS